MNKKPSGATAMKKGNGQVQNSEIRAVSTHAEDNGERLIQWADITIRIHKGIVWEKESEDVLKKIRLATALIGRGE
jgi:hypothetical protein